MIFDLALVSVFTGITCLDRRAIGQTMISQPLVSVSILGYIFGDLQMCLAVGAILQLFWMSANLYGANIPRNGTLASLTALGAVLIARKSNLDLDPNTWVIAVVFTMPFATIAQWLQGKLDRFNSRFSSAATERAEVGDSVPLFGYVVGAMGAVLISYTILSGIATGLCYSLIRLLYPYWTVDVSSAAGLTASFVLPALALAVSLSLIRRRLHLALSVLSFVILGITFQSLGLVL